MIATVTRIRPCCTATCCNDHARCHPGIAPCAWAVEAETHCDLQDADMSTLHGWDRVRAIAPHAALVLGVCVLVAIVGPVR